MAINTTLAGLSMTPALNGPDGSSDLPSQYDDAIRYSLSFIAQLRDGAGFTASGIPKAALAVPYVENGTGPSQTTDVVKIGFSAAGKLRVQAGATDYAALWPIDISGNAATAGNATLAGGFTPATGFLRNSDPTQGVVGMRYDSPSGQLIPYVNGEGFGAVWPINTNWSLVVGRPSDLASFSNSPGYVNAGGAQSNALAVCVQRIDAVTQMGNVGATSCRANIAGFGLVGWGVTPSDERLKKDIAPTREDSLAKICRIDFKQFRFKNGEGAPVVDQGRLHTLGVIAQDLETIDPEWINEDGTWLAPERDALLYAALHAIKQQQAQIETLRDRISMLEAS